MNARLEHFRYDDAIVRKFVVATVVWGFVAMLVGVILAAQLAHYQVNGGLSWLTFGRLRPLHTNAAIFAFAGNAVFAGTYYSVQRLLKSRMFSDKLSAINFWGWQAVIILAAVTLPLGITVSKEYAELEWPLDIMIAVVWIALMLNLFGTLAVRRERHIYVAIWFYIATVVAIAMLHIVNSLELPVSWFKSYSVYAGVQDALVQWWYGHNAVAFFLTTPFLGLMYYFVPKAAERPIYSYRLSIIHFWSLVFVYIWAGPHHLLNSSLPEWAQTMGVVFSIMLIAPSWGGMLNGLLTLRGAWDRLREDVILKFFVVGVTFYGMSTLEGPLLATRSINALSHFTDWTIAHVHGGTLGWNGFVTFGMVYWLVPRLWKVEMHSKKLMAFHFWVSTVGIVLYLTSMWSGGITQGLMWRALGTEGGLKYPVFLETVTQLHPFYLIRLLGGALYIMGMTVMLYNVLMTIRTAVNSRQDLRDTEASGYALAPEDGARFRLGTLHHVLEGRVLVFSILVFLALIIGSIVEIVPMLAIRTNVSSIGTVQPYTPLELEGRDLYVREGCYNCHSQMVRPLYEEVKRYGRFSESGEYVYDRPFQFGSKRTGPDLHRLGAKYPDSWHFNHMKDPRSISDGSIMPSYAWMIDEDLYTGLLQPKMEALKRMGTQYTEADITRAPVFLEEQARAIAGELQKVGVKDDGTLYRKEIIALIAYLQRLGVDIRRPQ